MNQHTDIESIAFQFHRQALRYGDRTIIAHKIHGMYQDVSWDTLRRMVQNTAAYLISIGIQKGDRVGVYSPTRYEWWIADLAALTIGAITVPVHATNSAEETLYVLKHSEARACFVGDDECLNKVYAIKNRLPDLMAIVTFDETAEKDALSLESAMSAGNNESGIQEVEGRLRMVKADDIATFMYTSGTTGEPKAVMLTHGNFYSNVQQVYREVSTYINDSDVFLSFMPLSHSLERTCGYYFPIQAGCKVCFAESLSTLLQDLQTVRPTILISAPRIYEKVRALIFSKAEGASAIKRMLFKYAISAAKKNLPYVCTGKKQRGIDALNYAIADRLVLSNMKKALGLDRLSFAISGGAPLAIGEAEFFLGMGLKILDGYGLTETSPVTHCNRPWLIKPGTVGPAVPDTEAILDPETGEILIQGPQVMKGYYRNETATSDAFDKNGFFRTGDIGSIDEDGYFSITGRIKDIIITAGGKNISPQNIENSIKESRYIEQIAIIGDRRKYLSALIVPSREELQRWARANGVSAATVQELISHPDVISFIRKEIDAHTAQYSRIEQIRKFCLIDKEWSQESGEMTPSLKVKRKVIEKKFAGLIQSMYDDTDA